MHVLLVSLVVICSLSPDLSSAFIITYHYEYEATSYIPENDSEWCIIRGLDNPKKVEVYHNHQYHIAFIPWDHKKSCAYKLDYFNEGNAVIPPPTATFLIFSAAQVISQQSFTTYQDPSFNHLSLTSASGAPVSSIVPRKKRERSLCRNYLNGYCQFKHCKFQHLKSCEEAPTICLDYLNRRKCHNRNCTLQHIDEESEIPKELPKCSDCQAYGHRRKDCPY